MLYLHQQLEHRGEKLDLRRVNPTGTSKNKNNTFFLIVFGNYGGYDSSVIKPSQNTPPIKNDHFNSFIYNVRKTFCLVFNWLVPTHEDIWTEPTQSKKRILTAELSLTGCSGANPHHNFILEIRLYSYL